MPNKKNEASRSSLILFCPLFFIMLILEIIHLPASISPFRPDFMMLLLIFFIYSDPQRINIITAWLCGIVLDFLTGAPLGINGLTISVQLYVMMFYFPRFLSFRIFQQMAIICAVNFVCKVLMFWLGHIIRYADGEYSAGYQTLSTMLFWPVIFIICSVLWSAFNVGKADSEKEKTL